MKQNVQQPVKRRRFPLLLIGLVLLVGIGGVVALNTTQKWKPWVQQRFPGLLASASVLPKSATFSVALAPVQGDQQDEMRTLLLADLQNLSGVKVQRFDQVSHDEGGSAEGKENSVQQLARTWLRESHSDVLMWGEILPAANGGEKQLQLFIMGRDVDDRLSSRLDMGQFFELPVSAKEALKVLVRVQILDKLAAMPNNRTLIQAISPEIKQWETQVQKLPAGPVRGMCYRALGDMWQTLGERGVQAPILGRAIQYYQAALHDLPRASMPLMWAATQSSLGDAVLTLSERDPGTQKLEAAINIYRQALEVRKQDAVPFQWAETQNSLANALHALGIHISKTLANGQNGMQQLAASVALYPPILTVLHREQMPLQWATVQNNFAGALLTLGTREPELKHLQDAVATYQAALQERKREVVPLEWAATQTNLGNALTQLGKRSTGTQRLEEAVAAYRHTLEVLQREKSPLQWALVQNNLGNVLQTLGTRTCKTVGGIQAGTKQLGEAVAAYRLALEERTETKVPLNWAETQNSLGNALQVLGVFEKQSARFVAAVGAYRQALTVWTREKTPLQWAIAQNNLGNALRSYSQVWCLRNALRRRSC